MKYTDITGFMMIKGPLVEFLAGAFVPLSLLPPALAALVLLAWCGVLYLLG